MRAGNSPWGYLLTSWIAEWVGWAMKRAHTASNVAPGQKVVVKAAWRFLMTL
jgi:hypothetical protein